MPYLVLIVSDQAVPNLLFIRQFHQPGSFHYFITTTEMEDKNATDNLVAALKLSPDSWQKVMIDANDALLILTQLKNIGFSSEGEYLLNITGGNKLMSQMVFQHFLDYESKMFYSPINSDQYQQLYPEVLSIPKDKRISTTLNEYLRAYGFEITGEQPYFKGNPKPTVLFKKVLEEDGVGNVTEIIKAKNPEYKAADKNYLLGSWFEFYCYQFFKRIFCLGESQIGCSVGLKKIGSSTINEHDNEFDLMFILKNDLYVFECKVYSGQSYKKEKFQIPMYKLASLTQQFGLKCKKYLAVLAELPEERVNLDQLEQLRENLSIDKIISLEDFRNYQDQDILTVIPHPKSGLNEKLNLLIKKFNG